MWAWILYLIRGKTRECIDAEACREIFRRCRTTESSSKQVSYPGLCVDGHSGRTYFCMSGRLKEEWSCQ